MMVSFMCSNSAGTIVVTSITEGIPLKGDAEDANLQKDFMIWD